MEGAHRVSGIRGVRCMSGAGFARYSFGREGVGVR